MRRPELISVVVPLLNDAEHLPAQLEALAAQDYDGRWEVVVADNGSRDASVAIAERGVASLPGGRVVHAGARRSSGHARNAGAAEARGDFLAFCDADDVVSTTWLTELAEAAADADLVAGGVDRERLNGTLPRFWHRRPPRHLGVSASALSPDSLRFLAFASGTSTGVWTDVFHKLGGYEERWPAGEDMDLSWRAQLAGHRLAVTDRAVVHQRLRSDVRSLARQQFGYGLAVPNLHRRFARAGMPPVLARQTLGTCARILATAPLAAFSARARGRWTVAAALQAGQIVGSVRSPASLAD